MDRKKKAIIVSTLFILSIFLLVTLIPKFSYTPTLPVSSSSIAAKADPNSPTYPYWWNTSYAYRQEIVFNNTASPYAVVNDPVDVFMSFANGRCNNGTVRVQYWNSSSLIWSPGGSSGIPYQIWNATTNGTFYLSFTITFYINVSAASSASYFVYYDSGSGTTPSFPSQVSYSGSAGNWVFQGQNYNASVNPSIDGGKVYASYNNVNGSNLWSYDSQFDWDPEYDIQGVTATSFFGFIVSPSAFTWRWSSSGPATSHVDPGQGQQGPLFVTFKTGTDLNGTNSGYGPTNIGYANVTYRFFQWGWTAETSINITYSFTYGQYSPPSGFISTVYRFDTGTFIGNSWRFNPQLGKAVYKSGSGNNLISPFISTYGIGQPFWFAIYDNSTGRAAGVVDLRMPAVSRGASTWSYVLTGIGSNPEQWQRQWGNLNLTRSDYENEKYAFYLWNAAGDILDPFRSFADGVSATERQQYPLVISSNPEEHVHFTVHVQVTDHDGSTLANAIVGVNSSNITNKFTDPSGSATFYLELGTYNFSAAWSGTTSYESYTSFNTSTINTQNQNVTLVFSNITTLYCRTQFQDSNPVQNSYVNITKALGGSFVDSSPVNLTGWAVFHVNRSSVSGNYTIKAYWQNNTQLQANENLNYTNISVDSVTSINFTVPLGANLIETSIIVPETIVNPAWGTNVPLKVYWRDSSGNNLSTLNSSISGSLNWTLNYVNGTLAPGGAPTPVSPTVNGSDIYYNITVPSSLLFGGVTYQVYINATANSSSPYLPAANQTIISVQNATLSVLVAPLTGTYFWKHSDVTLWAYVNDSITGTAITSATVAFTITNTSFSGQLSASSQPGNYSYTIPASLIQANLNALTYTVQFDVSNTNYSTPDPTFRQLVINPALTVLSAPTAFQCFYGDLLNISVSFVDLASGTPITDSNPSTTVSYSVLNQAVAGNLVFDGNVSNNWTGTLLSTLLVPGNYLLQITTSSPNYKGSTNTPQLTISALSLNIISVDQIFGTVNENLTLSVQLNNTHLNSFNNNTFVSGATVLGKVFNSSGTQIVPTIDLVETDPVNNPGNYSGSLVLSPDQIPPGTYRLEIDVSITNYAVVPKNIALIVQGLPTVLSASEAYLSDLNAPAVILFGNFGMTENDLPFAFFTFSFLDSNGSVIPNANVSASGGYVVSQGNGQYALIVPTYGLPSGAYPIVVTGDPSLYGTQQSVFLLQINARTVLIPFANVRVPLSLFLVAFFAVAIPVVGFTSYMYVRRARIPVIIRRIDELISAMNRGVRVDVRLIPREKVISRILGDEVSVIGVEPRVEAYVPIELADRLVPLLVESGMGEKEAYAMVAELRKATPTKREKLLESVGVPEETSERVLQTIEKEEEKSELLRKPTWEVKKPKKAAKAAKEETEEIEETEETEEKEETEETEEKEDKEERI
ncbi:MAG: hypothetical protein WED07_04485 [Candidatus Freyarchaeum deiterrae]